MRTAAAPSSGCPLRCVYCRTLYRPGEAARAITVERLAVIMGELERAGALNTNCVTPTHFAPQIREVVARPASRAWCSGAVEHRRLQTVRQWDNIGFVTPTSPISRTPTASGGVTPVPPAIPRWLLRP
ncbi:MAG: hypothetical protein ACLUE1_01020 [Adlercreutzia equolifaciens]